MTALARALATSLLQSTSFAAAWALALGTVAGVVS